MRSPLGAQSNHRVSFMRRESLLIRSVFACSSLQPSQAGSPARKCARYPAAEGHPFTKLIRDVWSVRPTNRTVASQKALELDLACLGPWRWRTPQQELSRRQQLVR